MEFDFDIVSEVEVKYRKGNQLLFDHNSKCLEPLVSLMNKSRDITLVAWAFDCLSSVVSLFESKYREEKRLSFCIEVCKDWAYGKVKMPVAKRAILDAHKVAKEIDDQVYGRLAHSVGQGCSVIHARSHGIGLVFYELSALIYLNGLDGCNEIVNLKLKEYYEKLQYWEENVDGLDVTWASFLLKNNKIREI